MNIRFSSLTILLLSLLNGQTLQAEDNFRLRVHQTEVNTNTAEDVEAEIQFGKNIAARILGQFNSIKDVDLIRYVNLVGKTLAFNASRDDINFHFTVLDADFINAYSAPGGYIFITRGAIEMMSDEAELAAVLAHEIAHITEKHIVKEFKIKGTEKNATAGLSQLLGSASSSAKVAFSKAVDNAINMLLQTGYKQADELEADHTALFLMAASGYDPVALPRLMTKIKTMSKNADSITHKSTHPPTDSRIARLQEIVQQQGFDKLQFPIGSVRFAKHAIN